MASPRKHAGFSLKTEAVDFDEEGLCVRADRPLKVGSTVRLRFRLPRSAPASIQGLACRLDAAVRDVRLKDPRAGGGYDIVLKLETPLSQVVRNRQSTHRVAVTGGLGAIIISLLALKWSSLDFFWYQPILYSYSWGISLYFLSRILLAYLHRSPELKDYTPSISICISVRNDDKAIERAIDTCFDAEYPDDKREVIVVDDGSTDQTPQVLAQLQERYPKLHVFRIPPSGKRHGMSLAVRKAAGELVVFVDSDTFLDRMALRHIVSGFEDPTLGAVSGHTEADNPDENMLTGLQQLRYYVSLKLMKAAESYYGCVTCCPGCLSAYRKEYLLKVLDEWLAQRFLGAPATFGDDRALTRYILRDYRVIYNHYATATTVVPNKWMWYMRQQVRWKKSWIRETLLASRFMWAKHPFAAISFYAAALVSLMSPAMAYRAIYLQFASPNPPTHFYVVGMLLLSFSQSFYYLYREANSRWAQGLVLITSHLLILGPQTYYAVLTLRKNHWGTR